MILSTGDGRPMTDTEQRRSANRERARRRLNALQVRLAHRRARMFFRDDKAGDESWNRDYRYLRNLTERARAVAEMRDDNSLLRRRGRGVFHMLNPICITRRYDWRGLQSN